jgi:hypothetical protein
LTISQGFGGDGQRLKQVENNRATYQIRSSVLGEVIWEIGSVGGTWQKKTGFVYGAGRMLATQTLGLFGNQQIVPWRYQNPVTGSQRGLEPTELDPLGLNAGLAAAEEGPPGGGEAPDLVFPRFGDILNGSSGCTQDGAMASCDSVMSAIDSGAAAQCPDNDCGPRIRTVTAYGNNGQVLGSTSTIVLPGQLGWDGAADGRYRPAEVPVEGGFSISWGGRLFNRESGGIGPQNTGTNPFPNFGKDDLKRVTDSIKLAKEMTDPKKHKECDEALKAYGIPSLAALINGMTPNGNVFDGRTSTLTGSIGKNGATQSVADYFKENKESVGAVVFPNSVTGRGPVTFLGAAFFNPASVDWIARQRAIIILHEAIHQVGGKGDALFGSSKELSEKIIEKCYPGLKGKLGGVG